MGLAVAIRAKEVRFVYSDGTEALKGVNLEVGEGERFALLGPNGAGKSTFLMLLNGLYLPTAGRLEVFGLEVSKAHSAQLRRLVGLVFQDPDDQLFMPTVLEDVAFGPLNLGLPPEEAEAKAKEALRAVELEGFENRHPHHLSMGERRRAALASVLSMRPRLLALDEPTANLDPRSVSLLVKALEKFDGTLVVATHDVEFARLTCERTAIMDGGKVVAEGRREEIVSDPALLRRHRLMLDLF